MSYSNKYRYIFMFRRLNTLLSLPITQTSINQSVKCHTYWAGKWIWRSKGNKWRSFWGKQEKTIKPKI